MVKPTSEFLNQKPNENRDLNKTLDIAWDIISNLNNYQIIRIHQNFIDKYTD